MQNSESRNHLRRRNARRSFAIRYSSFAILGLLAFLGCVRRTMTITTAPPHALVFLNDQEIGRSEVSTDFLWYGDYDVVIRKEGYKTLKTHWDVKPPWYQRIPLDFFSEVLWPGHLVDAHCQHFELEPQKLPTPEDLTERALETRRQATDVTGEPTGLP